MDNDKKSQVGSLKYNFSCMCGFNISKIADLLEHKQKCELVSVCYEDVFNTM